MRQRNQVTGVAANDVLNVRTGPGTQYAIGGSFAPNARGLQQITCVPLHTPAQFAALTPAQVRALPPRWCLMRDATMTTAGWVAQRFITPDDSIAAQGPDANATSQTASVMPAATGDAIVTEATSLVRNLYDAQTLADRGQGPDLLSEQYAGDYFTSEIVALFRSGGLGAHPLYGAQDFDGRVTVVAADSEQPVLRMVTIHADFTNFGQPERASYCLRADTNRPGAPLRIFRVEHKGWSYP